MKTTNSDGEHYGGIVSSINQDEGEFWFGQLAIGIEKRFVTNLHPYEELHLEICRSFPKVVSSNASSSTVESVSGSARIDVEPQVAAKPKWKLTILSDELISKARPPMSPDKSHEDYEYLEESADAMVEVPILTPQQTTAKTPSNTSQKVS